MHLVMKVVMKIVMKVLIKVERNNEGDNEGSDEGGGVDCNLFERCFNLWQADGLTDEWTDIGDCWVAFVTENLKPNLPV